MTDTDPTLAAPDALPETPRRTAPCARRTSEPSFIGQAEARANVRRLHRKCQAAQSPRWTTCFFLNGPPAALAKPRWPRINGARAWRQLPDDTPPGSGKRQANLAALLPTLNRAMCLFNRRKFTPEPCVEESALTLRLRNFGAGSGHRRRPRRRSGPDRACAFHLVGANNPPRLLTTPLGEPLRHPGAHLILLDSPELEQIVARGWRAWPLASRPI